MEQHLTARPASLRTYFAAFTPKWLRKGVRMAEHYRHRLRSWRDVHREFAPADLRSAEILRRSLIRAPLTALAELDSFQPPRLLGDVEVEIAGIGRFAVRAGTDDVLHVLTAREPEIRRTIERLLPPGGVFVDAGANIGFYTVLAARLVGPAGHVFAFEMMPDTAAILRRHVESNGCRQVEIVERALSDRSGATIAASVEPGKHGQASILPEVRADGRTVVEVETITLDAALTQAGPIDLLKMDLEGAEYLALRGAAAMLARTACVVFESNGEDRRVFDLLEEHGFSIRRLAGYDFIAQRPAEGVAR